MDARAWNRDANHIDARSRYSARKGPASNFVARHEIRVGRSAYKAAHTAGTNFVATATKSRQDFHSEDQQSPPALPSVFTPYLVVAPCNSAVIDSVLWTLCQWPPTAW